MPNQSTPGSTNVGQMTIGLLDHLLDCLFSNESPNDSLTKRLGNLVHDLELFEPPKIEDTKSLEFINLREKFQRLRAEKLQDDKICATSKSLSDRVMPLIERLFSLPKLPEDMWKNQILPMLALADPLSPIKMTLGKMQINRQMDKLVTETIRQIVESERCSLKLVGCTTADEAINFVINYQLTVVNLKDFPDLKNEHLKTLAEQCPQLKHLLLSSDNVTEVPNFAALQSLDLSGCENLPDAGLAHLNGLTALLSLNLSYCENLTDAGLAHLKEFTALQSLNLTGCLNLTDAGLAHLKELKALQSLNLCFCYRLRDASLAHLKELTALQSLNLTGCENLTDAGLVHLKELRTVQSLNFSGCPNLTDAGLVHLKGLTTLQSLDLSGCENLPHAGLAHLNGLTALQSLNLSDCSKLTDAGLAPLNGLTALQSLYLSAWNLTDAGLAHLNGLTALQSLYLCYCENLTITGLAHLKELTTLRSLNLSGCENLTDAGLAHLKELLGIQIFRH